MQIPRRVGSSIVLPGVIAAALLSACREDAKVADVARPAPISREEAAAVLGFDVDEKAWATLLSLGPLVPPPLDPSNEVDGDARAERLGHFLFYDRGLSSSGEVSCATCHDPTKEWGDGRQFSMGVAETKRHAPSLWNVAAQRWFFWDGRADSLWSQALGPIEADDEMAFTRVGVARRIFEDPRLRAAYETLFGAMPALGDRDRLPLRARPRPSTPEHPEHQAWATMRSADRHAIDRVFANVGKSIAAFERLIVSRDSPFDRFVAALKSGDREAASSFPEAARRGLAVFLGKGQCTLCHLGPHLSDREFHNLGFDLLPDRSADLGRHDGVPLVLASSFSIRGVHSAKADGPHVDKVRYLIQKPNNIGEFKTPTLRNVARSAPYMHDGRFADLNEVVNFYSVLDQRTALGHREETMKQIFLSKKQIADVIALLETFTGVPLDEELTRPPTSP